MTRTSTAIAGMTWILASNAAARLVSLAGQIALGWFLIPEDFGVYAFAISLATAVAVLRNGGTSQVLIKLGDQYPQRAGLILKYSFFFNCAAMLMLLAIAAPYWAQGSAVGIILSGIAISLPVGTPAAIFRSKLTIDGRYSQVAQIALWSAILWQSSVVACAFLGFGALSFAAPQLLQAVYETAAGWYFVRRLPDTRQRHERAEYVDLFKQTRWLMLSTATLAFATTGVYFVASVLTDAKTVGIFFFAFQLIVALGTPIYAAVENVLPALLTQMDSDRHRQADAFLRAVRTSLIVTLPLIVAFGLAMPALIHMIWQGKWDAAIPSATMLAACIPAWVLVTIGRALVEARGQWRLRFIVMALYGVGAAAATGAGAATGTIDAIALWLTVFYAGFSLLFLVFLAHRVSLSLARLAQTIVPALTANSVALLLGLWVAEQLQLFGTTSVIARSSALGSYLLIAAICNRLLFHDVWSDIFCVLIRRLRRALPSSRISESS